MMEVREITGEDIPQIIALYAKHLTSGESISQAIREAWNKGEYGGYIALSGGETAGFMTVHEGIAFTYPHPALEEELAAFVKDRRIGYCDALLILPDYRNEGVAHHLVRETKKQLVQIGFDYFLSEIWIYPDGRSPAKEVFETMGKIVWQRRIDGFYREFPSYGMSCPFCGENCVCGAWVDVMELER